MHMRVRISSSFHLTRGKFIYTIRQWRRGSIGWIYVMCNCLCYHLLSVEKEGDTSADKLCSFLQHNSATQHTYDWQRQDQVWINRSEMQSWPPSLKVADLQAVSFIITSCYEQSHILKWVVGGKKWPQTTITSSIFAPTMLTEHMWSLLCIQ